MLNIYTDGGCRPNPGTGGYGVVFVFKNRCKQYNGRIFDTTNNRMEIEAVRVALLTLDQYLLFIKKKYNLQKDPKIKIHTDSVYVIDGLTKWGKVHDASNWTSNRAQKVKNINQWKELHTLWKKHNSKNIDIVKIKGHSGDKGNDMADKLATDAIKGTIV